MLRLHVLFVSLLSASALTVACGSDKDGEGGLSSGAAPGSGSTGSGGSINIGTGGTNGLTGTHDGGTVPLTEDQIDEIEMGACAGWTTEGENLPAVLELVIDVSSSMNDPAPGNNRSKWAVTRDALQGALDGLSAQTSVGLLFYPNTAAVTGNQPQDVSACVNVDAMIPIDVLGAPGSPHRTLLASAIDQAELNQSTPTHSAYEYALDSGMRPYVSEAPKFMLLITDGAPTLAQGCVGNPPDPSPTQPIIDEVIAAAADGIKTFVIGSPGSETNPTTGEDMRPWLSRAAIEGGTATPGCSEQGPNFCHFDMTEASDFAQALRAGLGAIVGTISSCTYVVPAAPPGQAIDLAQANVVVTSSSGAELILPDNTGGCEEGWQVNAEQQIVLCEATCNRLTGDAQAHVEVLFGCASGEVPVTR